MNDMSGHNAFGVPAIAPVSGRPFALVLLPGFSMLSLSGLTDPMRAANAALGGEHYRWSLHSTGEEIVQSSGGIPVRVEGSLATVEPASNVILVGGQYLRIPDFGLLRVWLRRIAVKAPLLGGTGSAVRLLADAGLLDGYKATIHWELADVFREAHPEINVTEALFEIDRKRLTCAGEAAATDMMLNIIASHSGKDVANTVAARLVHMRMRSAAEPQAKISLRTGSRNKYLIRAIALMEDNADEVLDIETIAARCGCSRRHMERVFGNNLGCAPIMYYRNIRLERARRLLLETDMSCMEVAVACGFQSSTTFSNAYFRRFGRRPAKELMASVHKESATASLRLLPHALAVA